MELRERALASRIANRQNRIGIARAGPNGGPRDAVAASALRNNIYRSGPTLRRSVGQGALRGERLTLGQFTL